MPVLPPPAELEGYLAERRWQLALKRGLDIVGSLTLLVLLLPLLLVVAVLIRLTSPGPILFSQPRWGRRGRLFSCYKFRSMVVRQETALDPSEVSRIQQTGELVKLKRDPRVTLIGSLIRMTSVDELPQLFNVLKGDMSLVGPRPLMTQMLEPYPELRAVRGLVRPGLTGLWQIRDRRNNSSVLFMAAHDLEYIRRFSFWNDVKILAATLPVVVSRDGAF
jgi:lipopolysaccharide/colanic/teichoic acid biosynthesis glycosyltransferase